MAMRMVCFLWLVLATMPASPCAAEDPRFESDIRPILKAHCFHCHGEAGKVEGGLDLRLVRFQLTGGDSGPAIVPQDPNASEMLRRIDAMEMPPGGKGLPTQERDLIARWIETGATTLRPEPETIDEQLPWTEEELSHWAFLPMVRQPSPTVNNLVQARGPIDAWLLATLEVAGQSFSSEANRSVLLRRVTLDLTGLPPEPSDVEAFAQDQRPDAYERVVDRLLASPRFGQRWARRWLDVAGYADSEGYVSSDPIRPWAFQYRDWVIEAFDSDKPFDEFVIEQLAGDELDEPHTGTPSPLRIERLTATGFLRTAPDGTGAGPDDPLQAKHDVVAESLKTISTGLLGLTVGCARCHDHRYDPISQRDYFALASIFEPAWDLEQWKVPGGRLVDLWTDEDRAKAAAVDARIAEIEGEYNTALDALVEEIFEKKVAELPEDHREAARVARNTPAAERNEEQQTLLRENPNLNVDRGSATLYEPARVKELNDTREAKMAEARKERPAERFVSCLTESVGRTPNARLLLRGEAAQPLEEVVPADLSLLTDRRASIPVDDPAVATSGRRLAWARSLTSPTHPLLSRVWVNRVWAHYFGEGIVRSLGDFGLLGEKPTHPQLLDQLALDFLEGNWLNKHFHRKLVTSHAYRQQSLRTRALESLDPENRWLGRMSVKRMEAEVVRDSMLAVTEELYERRFGPSLSVTQDAIGQVILGTGERDGNGILVGSEEALGRDRFRRSIYVQLRRTMPLAVLEPFDPAKLDPNCPRRDVSTSASQSLLMLNGRFPIDRSRQLSDRIFKKHPDDPTQRIAAAWLAVCGTTIDESEAAQAAQFLAEQEQLFAIGTADDAAGRTPQQLAFDTYCQALYASNRFLYIE